MQAEYIIKRPLVLTEKGARLTDKENKYLFEVARDANKIQIKDAVETLFNVTVTSVRTLIVRGRNAPTRIQNQKVGITKYQNWKKAIVELKDGESIELGT